MQEQLHEYAQQTGSDKLAFLKLSSLFTDLIDQPDFSQLYINAINLLYVPTSNIKNIMKTTLEQKLNKVALETK